jgi:primosomal protein N'
MPRVRWNRSAWWGGPSASDEIAKVLPSARIARMDRDTVRTDAGARSPPAAFDPEIDVLVAQMIAKGTTSRA